MEIKMSLIPGKKPGTAGKIQVKPGQQVAEGDMLVQVETGKGNRPVKAPSAGIIEQVLFGEGEEIKSNQVLFVLSEAESAEGDTAAKVHEEKREPAAAAGQNGRAHDLEADLLVIGGGPGGYVAAIYAAKRGLKVVLAEKEQLGGACLNVGCIPTKALVKSADVYSQLQRAGEFGICADAAVKPDMKKIIERKDAVKDKLVSGVRYLLDKNGVRVLYGKASFISDKKVQVDGAEHWEVQAENIIVATGSKASKIKIPGIDLPIVMDSTRALSSEQLPQSIIIIGGGVIGMEFAFIYSRLGVKVHVVEFLDRLLNMVDGEASEEIRQEAVKAGIRIHTGSRVKEIRKTADDQAVVIYDENGREEVLAAEKVLAAIGREPNLDGLDYEKAGLALKEKGRGLAVNGYMQTNREHIYAIGDVTDIIQLAHVASHQGIAAVEHILGGGREMNYRAVPNVIFTAPEIAGVGLTEEECRSKGIECRVSRFAYEGNGKALTMGEPSGFIKLLGDAATGKILGATIMGADASSLIAAVTLAVEREMTAEEVAGTIFAHPTTAEIIHEAAMGLGIGALHQ